MPIISPYKLSRQNAEKILNPDFNEVYCKCNLDILIKRDTKGLYAKSISGELNNLIGFSSNSPYEPPSDPNIIINMGENNVDESVNYLYRYIKSI